MSFNITNIKLGSPSTKKYSRNMNFDNNTTMPFGFVQPLMSQRLEANSDISINLKQLVRLAPMPVPTFGRMKIVNKSVYVPISDVLPYYEALLKGQQYKSSIGSSAYIPTQIPFTNNAFLQYVLLNNSFFTLYKSVANDTFQMVQSSSLSGYNWVDVFQKLVFGKTVTFPRGFYELTDKENYVSFDGADYIVKIDDTHYVCFRYTQAMRNLRSILVGLGYGLDLKNGRSVSILPLLCFYKAYFDTYVPKRKLSWTDTYCFGFIKQIEDKYMINFLGTSTNANYLYQLLVKDIANSFYASPDDFISVHRTDPVTSVADKHVDNFVQSNADSQVVAVPTPVTNTTVLDNILLNAIQRLSHYVNKDSVIGTKMSDWLRVHFGADVANSLYKDIYQVKSFDFPLNVDDIFSTADTAVTAGANKGDGEFLGAYAGKGLGYGNSQIKFHSPYAGYFFVLSSIVPISGYNQGDQSDLYLLDNDTIPNPDFDALGYELNPMSLFVDHNGIDIPSDDPTPFSNVSFGYVPRYSSLKVRRNIANGDISRRGSIASLSPYHLDRNITSTVVEANKLTKADDQIVFHISTTYHLPPSSSDEWRYVCKYPFLGNFNRIFHNSGQPATPTFTDSQAFYYATPVDDNFIVQSLFEVTVTDFLKPLSESWDTLDQNDNTTKDVQPD